MKNVLWSLMAVLMLASCQQLKMKTTDDGEVRHQRTLRGFERITLLGSLDVKYQQADSFSVVVVAPQKLVEYVQTRVENRRLVVSMKGDGQLVKLQAFDGDDVTVYVTSPDLIGVELRGSGDFDCKHQLDTDTLDVVLAGSGDIEFDDVVCDRLNVLLLGSGDVDFERVASHQTAVDLTGSGDIKIKQRNTAQTNLTIKGSGDIEAWLYDCGTVNAECVGSGDVKLGGTIDKLNSRTRGSGDIRTDKLNIRKK